jgi:osomolarity two-component system phosphorelay intermediate protein YPD1
MSDLSHPDPIQPIDFGEVLDRIGGDTSFLKELLNIYFQEYEKKKGLLDRAIADQDFTLLSELGHSLKGSSANLSLTRLRKTAHILETAGKEKKLQPAREVQAWTSKSSLKAFLPKTCWTSSLEPAGQLSFRPLERPSEEAR